MPAHRGLQHVHLGCQLLHQIDCRTIHVGVDRIQPQSIEMVVAQPHTCVVAEEAPHLVAACIFQIHSVAPRRLMAVGKIRAEFSQVISRGTQVVVDHIEQHGQSVRVAGFNQTLECFRTAVRLVRRKEVDPVITPAMPAGKGRDRHQLHMCYPQLLQRFKLLACCVECALRGERANVQLVNNRALERWCLPPCVLPCERRVVHNARRTVHAKRLPLGAWVRHRGARVDHELIIRTGPGIAYIGLPPAALGLFHGMHGLADLYADSICPRRPHSELMHCVSNCVERVVQLMSADLDAQWPLCGFAGKGTRGRLASMRTVLLMLANLATAQAVEAALGS